MHATTDMRDLAKIISNSMPALEQLQYIGNGLTSARTSKQTTSLCSITAPECRIKSMTTTLQHVLYIYSVTVCCCWAPGHITAAKCCLNSWWSSCQQHASHDEITRPSSYTESSQNCAVVGNYFFCNLLFFYKFTIRWCAANLQVWIDNQLWSGWKRTVWGQYYGWRKISYAAFLFIDCWLFSLTACGGWQLGGHQLCHQGSKGGAHKCSPSVFHCRRSEHYEVS